MRNTHPVAGLQSRLQVLSRPVSAFAAFDPMNECRQVSIIYSHAPCREVSDVIKGFPGIPFHIGGLVKLKKINNQGEKLRHLKISRKNIKLSMTTQ